MSWTLSYGLGLEPGEWIDVAMGADAVADGVLATFATPNPGATFNGSPDRGNAR